MKIDFKKYEKNGWIKIKNFIHPKKIQMMDKNVKNFLEKNFMNYETRFINFVNNEKNFKNINSFHKLDDCKWIKNYSKSPKLTSFVKRILKTKSIKLRQAEYFAKPKKKGLAAPDHQDNFFWNLNDSNAITIWISLSNSSKKNGGVYYYDASHKYGILNHKKSYMKGTSQMIKNKKFLKSFNISHPSLKRGDALIHHSLIVHGSKKNKSQFSRKGITFQYITKKAKIDKIRAKIYEKSLYKQIKFRNLNAGL